MSETAPLHETEGQHLLRLADTITDAYPSWLTSFSDGVQGRFSVGVHYTNPLESAEGQQVILFNGYDKGVGHKVYVTVQPKDLFHYMTFFVDSERAKDVFVRDNPWPQDCSDAESLLLQTDFSEPGPVLALRDAYRSRELKGCLDVFVSPRLFID